MDKKTILAIVATGAVCLSTVGAGAAGNNAQKDATTKFERPRIKRIEYHKHNTANDSIIEITYVDFRYEGDHLVATNQDGESHTTLMKSEGSYEDEFGKGQMKFNTRGQLKERKAKTTANIDKKRFKSYSDLSEYSYEYTPEGKMKSVGAEAKAKYRLVKDYAKGRYEKYLDYTGCSCGPGPWEESEFRKYKKAEEALSRDSIKFQWEEGDLMGIVFEKVERYESGWSEYGREYLTMKFIYGEEENKYGIPAFVDPYIYQGKEFPFNYDPYLSGGQLAPRHLPKMRILNTNNEFEHDHGEDFDYSYWTKIDSKRYREKDYTEFPMIYDWQTDEKARTVRCIITRRPTMRCGWEEWREGNKLLADTIIYQF